MSSYAAGQVRESIQSKDHENVVVSLCAAALTECANLDRFSSGSIAEESRLCHIAIPRSELKELQWAALTMEVSPRMLPPGAVTINLSTRSFTTPKWMFRSMEMDRSAPRSIIPVYPADIFQSVCLGFLVPISIL